MESGLSSSPWGAVAQLGERLVRNEEASGSIPLSSTTLRPDGATRGAATGSNSALGEAVSGGARRAQTDWPI